MCYLFGLHKRQAPVSPQIAPTDHKQKASALINSITTKVNLAGLTAFKYSGCADLLKGGKQIRAGHWKPGAIQLGKGAVKLGISGLAGAWLWGATTTYVPKGIRSLKKAYWGPYLIASNEKLSDVCHRYFKDGVNVSGIEKNDPDFPALATLNLQKYDLHLGEDSADNGNGKDQPSAWVPSHYRIPEKCDWSIISSNSKSNTPTEIADHCTTPVRVWCVAVITNDEVSEQKVMRLTEAHRVWTEPKMITDCQVNGQPCEVRGRVWASWNSFRWD